MLLWRMSQESQRSEFDAEFQRQASVRDAEVEELTLRHVGEVSRMQQEVSSALRSRDELLLLADSSKQKVVIQDLSQGRT